MLDLMLKTFNARTMFDCINMPEYGVTSAFNDETMSQKPKHKMLTSGHDQPSSSALCWQVTSVYHEFFDNGF